MVLILIKILTPNYYGTNLNSHAFSNSNFHFKRWIFNFRTRPDVCKQRPFIVILCDALLY